MPIYEYACAACGHQFEEWQKMSDPPVRTCPKCKKRKVEKLISQTAFQLKGGGWYADLYSSAKPGAKSGDGAEGGGGKDSAKEGGKENKTADASSKSETAGSSDKAPSGDKANKTVKADKAPSADRAARKEPAKKSESRAA
jgi:putative FmdB family regulatory protein